MNLDIVALAFIVVVAAVNLRGISESVKVNVALTAVEVTGLLLIVAIGVAALAQGDADFSRNFEFREGESVVAVLVGGASLAFYALIGFEDAVNVAEETKDPSRAFPRALFLGLAIAGVIYLLVTMTASMVVSTDVLAESDGALLEVVREGPLGIPVKLFSVHRPAGGGQRRADQHDHGLAAGLRHVAPGHRAARVRPDAARPAARPTSPSSSPRCWPWC